MKKLLACICILMMTFTFASCQTSAPLATPTGMYKNIDAEWSGTINWKANLISGSYNQSLIAQKGVIDVKTPERHVRGIIEGNTIHMESCDWEDVSTRTTLSYPDRDYSISEDGKTIIFNFVAIIRAQESGGHFYTANANVDGVLIRK